MPLNQSSRADYYFGGEDGKTYQFNRVQTHELLSNIDSMEDELRRYYDSADENNMIIEGLISPLPFVKRNRDLSVISVRRKNLPSTLFTYSVTDSGFIYNEHAWSQSINMIYAWVFQLSRFGISTFYTINVQETAKFIAIAYKNRQTPDEQHSTLNRYYRPRIQIKEQNPFIRSIMSLSIIYKLDIGEVKSTALAERFKTIADVLVADETEICQCAGIAHKTAHKLLEALGREG